MKAINLGATLNNNSNKLPLNIEVLWIIIKLNCGLLWPCQPKRPKLQYVISHQLLYKAGVFPYSIAFLPASAAQTGNTSMLFELSICFQALRIFLHIYFCIYYMPNTSFYGFWTCKSCIVTACTIMCQNLNYVIYEKSAWREELLRCQFMWHCPRQTIHWYRYPNVWERPYDHCRNLNRLNFLWWS